MKHTRIIVYENVLVIETRDKSDKGHFVVQPMGCVLQNTKKHLEVSKKAITLMKKMRKGTDDMSGFTWWGSGNEWYIGWAGEPSTVVFPKLQELCIDGKIPDESQYTIVENKSLSSLGVVVDGDWWDLIKQYNDKFHEGQKWTRW